MILRTLFYGAFSPPGYSNRNRVSFMGAKRAGRVRRFQIHAARNVEKNLEPIVQQTHRIRIIVHRSGRKSRNMLKIIGTYRSAAVRR